MANHVEPEERLRRLAEVYDDVVPNTPGLERRVMARIAIYRGDQPSKPTLGRDLLLTAAVIVFVAAVAIGLINVRSLQRPVHQPTLASPTPMASITPAPSPPVPADDLVAAGLTNDLVTAFDVRAVDQGHNASLLGGYADPARTILIFHLEGMTSNWPSVEVKDDQGPINASGSARGIRSTGDYLSILEGGPQAGLDGLAHLTIAVTSRRPGNGPGQIEASWNFSVALHIHPAMALPAPQQFPLARWRVNTEILELTPTVVHFQGVISGASPPEIGLSTVTLLDAAGNVLGQGCGASITVSKTQIDSPSSPLYHNARVYCEFPRPSAVGLYQLRFEGGGGTYLIPISIKALTGQRPDR